MVTKWYFRSGKIKFDVEASGFEQAYAKILVALVAMLQRGPLQRNSFGGLYSLGPIGKPKWYGLVEAGKKDKSLFRDLHEKFGVERVT